MTNKYEWDNDWEEDEDDDNECDYCYECGGYGDDYFVNDDGELECYCPQCTMNPSNWDNGYWIGEEQYD